MKYPVYNFEWIRECQKQGRRVDSSKYLLSGKPDEVEELEKNHQASPSKSTKPIIVKRAEKSKWINLEDNTPGPSNDKVQPAKKKTKTLATVVYSRSRTYSTKDADGKSKINSPKADREKSASPKSKAIENKAKEPSATATEKVNPKPRVKSPVVWPGKAPAVYT